MGAHGRVPQDGGSVALTMLGFMPALALTRLLGGHRDNPFFDRAGVPVVTPRVLTREERARATQAAEAAG